MDTLIGNLNEKVAKNTYTGGETDTTITTVNNATNIITVDTKVNLQKLDEDIKSLKEQVDSLYKAINK